MSDLKTSIQKNRFCNFSEQDILIYIESFLAERNLEKYVKSILFSHADNKRDLEVANYDAFNKEMIFNMDVLNRLRFFDDKDGINPITYNNILTLYEIFMAIEKVYLNNLGGDSVSNRLYKLCLMEKEYNNLRKKEKEKYFDDNDSDMRIYKLTSNASESSKISTLAPITRYLKVKPLYDTIDTFTGLYSCSNEMKLFYQNAIDLLYNGYIKNGNTISYPLYNYFSQVSPKEADKILSKFAWYNPDIFKALNNVSSLYSERERIIFGMPIDFCEHSLIRKRFEV